MVKPVRILRNIQYGYITVQKHKSPIYSWP